MKGPNDVNVSIVPQLGKACRSDMHKDKIVGFIQPRMVATKKLKNWHIHL